MPSTLAIRRRARWPPGYSVSVPTEERDFGPNRGPAWLGLIVGVVACLCAGLLLVSAGELAGQSVGSAIFFSIFGVAAAAFGVWMWLMGSRIFKLRATVTGDALKLMAHSGRGIWMQRSLAEATIPWAEVQGFSCVGILNPSAKDGTQSTYILYTKRGDFTLNDVQWNNLAGLMREISVHTGRPAGEVTQERTAAVEQVHAGERRMFSIQRILGRILLGISAAMLLLVALGVLAEGFSSDLAKAAFFLIFAMSAGWSMIRFYRRR